MNKTKKNKEMNHSNELADLVKEKPGNREIALERKEIVQGVSFSES